MIAFDTVLKVIDIHTTLRVNGITQTDLNYLMKKFYREKDFQECEKILMGLNPIGQVKRRLCISLPYSRVAKRNILTSLYKLPSKSRIFRTIDNGKLSFSLLDKKEFNNLCCSNIHKSRLKLPENVEKMYLRETVQRYIENPYIPDNSWVGDKTLGDYSALFFWLNKNKKFEVRN